MHCPVHVTAWIQPFYSWTTVFSLWWLLLRCMPACARGCCRCCCCCCCCCVGRGSWLGCLWGSSPWAMEQFCTPQQPACPEKSAWMWKHAPTCPTENPNRKMGGAYSRVSLSTSHIFSPLTQRRASNDTTARQKSQFNITPEVFPLPLPFFILTTFRGLASCLCTTFTSIRKKFKCLSWMHVTNWFLLATWTE